jgi:hypothetical protein
MKIELYYNDKDKMYYYNNDARHCDYCDNIIVDVIIIKTYWDKLGSSVKYYCLDCKSKNVLKATVSEQIIAFVTIDIPSRSIPIPFVKPTLVETRNMSVFDAANMSIDCEKVIDKTRYSNRSNVNGVEFIGKDINAELEFKDRILYGNDGFEVLKELYNSKPVKDLDIWKEEER